ncbi:hypothetical protein NCAS_0A14480 [Naumovozyma castellii]|uniref:Uncharacterized protein n=1 Tax=Naumovozyma castellii TaxID=27288 RepID=G0V956_NAUCA|nr:hypothetical protein NCAS_0A14480 [Naumovozyma castellii CBS 4309]CCC68006.1 hypothetical protein NCAS_0A14480 [Naumovozyma castellii CBS 4309]
MVSPNLGGHGHTSKGIPAGNNNRYRERESPKDTNSESLQLKREYKKQLNEAIYNFLMKSSLSSTAKEFVRDVDAQCEVSDPKSGSIHGSGQESLYEWWQIFWDFFNTGIQRSGSEVTQQYFRIITAQENEEQNYRSIAAQTARLQYINEERGYFRNDSRDPMSTAMSIANAFSNPTTTLFTVPDHTSDPGLAMNSIHTPHEGFRYPIQPYNTHSATDSANYSFMTREQTQVRNPIRKHSSIMSGGLPRTPNSNSKKIEKLNIGDPISGLTKKRVKAFKKKLDKEQNPIILKSKKLKKNAHEFDDIPGTDNFYVEQPRSTAITGTKKSPWIKNRKEREATSRTSKRQIKKKAAKNMDKTKTSITSSTTQKATPTENVLSFNSTNLVEQSMSKGPLASPLTTIHELPRESDILHNKMNHKQSAVKKVGSPSATIFPQNVKQSVGETKAFYQTHSSNEEAITLKVAPHSDNYDFGLHNEHELLSIGISPAKPVYDSTMLVALHGDLKGEVTTVEGHKSDKIRDDNHEYENHFEDANEHDLNFMNWH